MKGDYQTKIMKFSKDTIVKAMCFTCLDHERVFNRCLDFEIDKKQNEMIELDKKIEQLKREYEKPLSELDRLRVAIEINKVLDKVSKLYIKILKLQDQYV